MCRHGGHYVPAVCYRWLRYAAVTTLQLYVTSDWNIGKCWSRCTDYDMFRWHCWQMPPLPARPVVDPREAEMKSKKQLGLTSKTLIGDELHKDCRQLEKCACLLLHEPVNWLDYDPCIELLVVLCDKFQLQLLLVFIFLFSICLSFNHICQMSAVYSSSKSHWRSV